MMEWELPHPDHEVVSCNGHGSVEISTNQQGMLTHVCILSYSGVATVLKLAGHNQGS